MTQQPLIFDIARGSTVDGPGLRTIVFIKGCPLRCIWCHNPESQSLSQEIFSYPERCNQCGNCLSACQEQAIDLSTKEIIVRDNCTACGACVDMCDTLALQRVGRYYEPDELVELLLRDRTFYDVSGGGVTFSGGEPLAWMHYLSPILRQLKNEGVHITIETCGYFEYELFKKEILPNTDLIYFDIKLVDTKEHERYTGKGNELILSNFEMLLTEQDISIIPRIPLIPGITATTHNLALIAKLFHSLGISDYRLLSYNPFGLDKWRRLGKKSHMVTPDKYSLLADEKKIKTQFRNLLWKMKSSSQPT